MNKKLLMIIFMSLFLVSTVNAADYIWQNSTPTDLMRLYGSNGNLSIFGDVNFGGIIYGDGSGLTNIGSASITEADPFWLANYSTFLTHIDWSTASNGTLYPASNPSGYISDGNTGWNDNYGFYNSSDFVISDYYLNNNPYAYYNSTTLPAAAAETDPLWSGNFSSRTGTGNVVYSASPTFTGTIVAASMGISGNLTINNGGVGGPSDSATSGLWIKNAANTPRLTLWKASGNALRLDNQGDGDIYMDLSDTTDFQVYDKDTSTSRFIVEQGGDVGIGTTNPQNKLDVSGNTNITGSLKVGGAWQDGGVTIDSGNIYAQAMYVYNITGLNVTDLNINGSLLPQNGFDNTFDIGSPTRRWNDIYAGGNAHINGSIYEGGSAISDIYVDESGDTMTGDLTLGSGAEILSGTDGNTFLRHTLSESNSWLFREASSDWGIFYFNKGTEATKSFGIFGDVGAETFFVRSGSATNAVSLSGYTGATANNYATTMIQQSTGDIWTAGDLQVQGGDITFGSTGISESDVGIINDGTITLGSETTGTYDSTADTIADDGTITLTSEVSGILPVENGGTETNTLTDHGVMLGSGVGAVTVTTAGTAGYALLGAGASADPTWTDVITETEMDTLAEWDTQIGITGTASSTTFMRGDNSWVDVITEGEMDALSEWDTQIGLTGTPGSGNFLRGDGAWTAGVLSTTNFGASIDSSEITDYTIAAVDIGIGVVNASHLDTDYISEAEMDSLAEWDTQIGLTGTQSSANFLRGDGAWTALSGSDISDDGTFVLVAGDTMTGPLVINPNPDLSTNTGVAANTELLIDGSTPQIKLNDPDAGDMDWWIHANDNLYFLPTSSHDGDTTWGSERPLVLTYDGKAGIGDASPDYLLDVGGTAGFGTEGIQLLVSADGYLSDVDDPVTINDDLTVAGGEIYSSAAAAIGLSNDDVSVVGCLHVGANDECTSAGYIELEQGATRTIFVEAEDSGSGNDLKIKAGDAEVAAGSFVGGDVFMYGGTGDVGGVGGDVYIYGGAYTSSGTYGDVILANSGGGVQGNVGVGITDPAEPLQVLTDSGGEAIAIEENSGGEQWELGVDVDGDLNIQNSGSIVAAFDDATNYFGIGDSDPDYNLEVYDTSNGVIAVNAGGTNTLSSFYAGKIDGGAYGVFEYTGAAADIYITNTYTNDIADIIFEPGNSESVRFDGDGSVGIGTTTPQAPLHVNSVAAKPTMILNRTSSYPSIQAGSDDSGYMLIESSGAGTGRAGFNWYNSDDVVLANGGGDVGIGSGATTPGARLDVSGGSILLDATQSVYGNAVSGSYGQIELYNGATGNLKLTTTFGSGDINLIPGSSGGVGIRTETPAASLHVYENIASSYAAIVDQDSSTGYGLQVLTDSVTAADLALDVQSGLGQVFSVDSNGLVIIGDSGAEDQTLFFDGQMDYYIQIDDTVDSLTLGTYYGSFYNPMMVLPKYGSYATYSNSGTIGDGRVVCNSLEPLTSTTFKCNIPKVNYFDSSTGYFIIDYIYDDAAEENGDAICLAIGGSYAVASSVTNIGYTPNLATWSTYNWEDTTANGRIGSVTCTTFSSTAS